MILANSAPVVSACIEAVADAIRQANPGAGISARQRTWLAFWGTATRVTPSMGWARFARARLGPSSLAALSWMLRHSPLPWDQRLVASVRVMLRRQGLTSGRLVSAATDNLRSKAATPLAYLYTLRDKESGGDVWGQSLLLLCWGTPNISMPGGVVFSQPDPARSAWYRRENGRQKPKGTQAPRQPKPAPTPHDPPKPQLASGLLADFTIHHPDIRVHGLTAEALYGVAPCVDAASARGGGVPGRSHIRSNQHIRRGNRAPHVAASCATHPGTPQRLCLRGGEASVAMVRRARF